MLFFAFIAVSVAHELGLSAHKPRFQVWGDRHNSAGISRRDNANPMQPSCTATPSPKNSPAGWKTVQYFQRARFKNIAST